MATQKDLRYTEVTNPKQRTDTPGFAQSTAFKAKKLRSGCPFKSIHLGDNPKQRIDTHVFASLIGLRA